MNRLQELQAAIKIANAGQHYLKHKDESDFVSLLCGEIDTLRTQLATVTAERDRWERLTTAGNERLDRIMDDHNQQYSRLRTAGEGLIPFATAYRSHPARNPEDELNAALSAWSAALSSAPVATGTGEKKHIDHALFVVRSKRLPHKSLDYIAALVDVENSLLASLERISEGQEPESVAVTQSATPPATKGGEL
jgi:hypothetical protein